MDKLKRIEELYEECRSIYDQLGNIRQRLIELGQAIVSLKEELNP
jgi:hypothetical protein